MRQSDAEELLIRGASSLRATYSNPGSRASSVSRSLTPEKPLRHTFTPEPENASLFDDFGCPIDPRDRKPIRPTVVRSSSESLLDEYGAGTGDEITVHSRLHWIGVMQDWQWEGMLHLELITTRIILTLLPQSFLVEFLMIFSFSFSFFLSFPFFSMLAITFLKHPAFTLACLSRILLYLGHLVC